MKRNTNAGSPKPKKWKGRMPASEDMMQEQLSGIIARMELRVEQKCVRANALAPYGAQAARARSELAQMLSGLEKLRAMLQTNSAPVTGVRRDINTVWRQNLQRTIRGGA